MEYITKKIPKDAEPLLYQLQAGYVLETGEKFSEAMTVKKAFEDALEHRTEIKAKKKYSFWDLKGRIRGGPKTNASEEIDKVVYGI